MSADRDLKQWMDAGLLVPEAKSGDGRELMSHERRALCFFAGGSSIFRGDKLLTTANPDRDADAAPPVAAWPRRNGVRGRIRATGADGAPVRAP